jgi:hypothetical protein
MGLEPMDSGKEKPETAGDPGSLRINQSKFIATSRLKYEPQQRTKKYNRFAG